MRTGNGSGQSNDAIVFREEHRVLPIGGGALRTLNYISPWDPWPDVWPDVWPNVRSRPPETQNGSISQLLLVLTGTASPDGSHDARSN